MREDAKPRGGQINDDNQEGTCFLGGGGFSCDLVRPLVKTNKSNWSQLWLKVNCQDTWLSAAWLVASVLPSGEHEFWGNPCHFRKKSRGRWGGISGLFKSWSKVKWRGDQIKNANLSTFSPSLSLSSLLSPRVSPPSFPRPERAASRAILESGGGKKRKEIEAPGLFGSLAGRQFPGLKGSAVGCLRNWQPLGLQRGCFSVKEGGVGCILWLVGTERTLTVSK